MDSQGPFQCEKCSYSCKLQQNLVTHMTTHQKGQPLLYCQNCPYVASNKIQLARHRNSSCLKNSPQNSTTQSTFQMERNNNNPKFHRHNNSTRDEGPRLVNIRGKVAQVEFVNFAEEENSQNHSSIKTSVEKPLAPSLHPQLRVTQPQTPLQSWPHSLSNSQLRITDKIAQNLASNSGQNPMVLNGNGQFERPRTKEGSLLKLKVLQMDIPPQTEILQDFPCSDCDKSYSSQDGLTAHRRTHGKNDPFKCPKCLFRCNQPDVLLSHVKTHRGSILFPCDLCEFECLSSKKLNRHRNQAHDAMHAEVRPMKASVIRKLPAASVLPSFKMTDFGRKFSMLTQRRYMQGFASEGQNQILEKKPGAPSGAKTVMKKKNPSPAKEFLFSAPEENIPTVINQSEPRKLKRKELISALLANEKYSSLRKKLGAPRKNPPLSYVYSCPTCPRVFASRPSLEIHIRVHTGEKPYQCPNCDYSCSQKGNLRLHLFTHRSGKELLRCALCDFVSSNSLGLRAHYKRDHEGPEPLPPPNEMSLPVVSMKAVIKNGPNSKISLSRNRHLEAPSGIVVKSLNVKERLKLKLKAASEAETVQNHSREKTIEAPVEKAEAVAEITPKAPLKMYRCYKCNYSSKLQIGLNKHMRVHEKEEEAKVKAEALVKKEEALEQKYVNTFCMDEGDEEGEPESDPLAIGEISQQESSEASAANNKQLLCPLCQQCFSREFLLDIHMRSHNLSTAQPIRVPSRNVQPDSQKGPERFSLHNVRTLQTEPTTAAQNLAYARSPAPLPAQSPALTQSSAPFLAQSPAPAQIPAPAPAPSPTPAQSRRTSTPEDQPKYHCPHCQKNMGSSQALAIHLRVHTGEKPFQCSLCSYTCNQQINLKTHMKSHRNGILYKCEHCDFTSSNMMTASLHNSDVHGSASPKKIRLSPQSQPPTNGTNGWNGTFGPRADSEHPAPTDVEDNNNNQVHIPPQFPPLLPQLPLQHYLVNPNGSIIPLHSFPLTNVQPSQQPLNHLSWNQTINFNMALNGKTPGNVNSTSNLNSVGKVVHFPNPVPPINGNFVHNTNLTEKNPSTNEIIRAERGQASEGNVEKPFACPYCGRRFRQRNQLATHVRIHTGEKPFKCTSCDYATSHQQSLSIHLRRHTGERPFSCNVCGHKTSSLPALYIHRKRHAKPFKCSYCPRESCDRAVMERHEQRHLELQG